MSACRGPLAGLRAVELASERGALAGKLLADMGAEVIVVEPPGGDATRTYPPFLDDEPGPERSLYWWHYNTSKLGVVLDLDVEEERALFRRLVGTADLLLEAEPPRRLAALGLDAASLRAAQPSLITVSITPFGPDGARAHEHAVDLTVLAGGGPVWSCGYDDHSLPPVRGGGNQGYHTACHFAVMSALVAVLGRDETGRGQHIDVNMHAAANVTTEAGSYAWLVAGATVQRQTGRHADPSPTMPTQVQSADGRWVNTGVPPRQRREFRALREWIDELGLRQDFPEAFLLELGEQRERIDFGKLAHDDELRAIFGAGREALNLLARRLPAYDFFTGCQERGLAVGIIYSPEEVLDDPHFRARGFPVQVTHEDLGRAFTYPGAPYRFTGTPWSATRAPHLGEHHDQVLGPLRTRPSR